MRLATVANIWILMTSLVALPASAETLIYNVCLDDYLRIEVPPFYLGCDLIGCCPNCPGPPTLDLTISVMGAPLRGVVFELPPVDFPGTPQRGIIGGGDWLGPGKLFVRRGQVAIRDFTSSQDDSAIRVRPRLKFRHGFPHGFPDAGPARPGFGRPRDMIHIEMALYHGAVQVGGHSFSYNLLSCGPGCAGPGRGTPIDTIDLSHNDGDDRSVVVFDSRGNDGCVNDQICVTRDIARVGNRLSSQGCNDEIIVFSRDDALQLKTPLQPWSDGIGDVVRIPLTPDRLQPGVKVWVADNDSKDLAEMELWQADQLYNARRTGIALLGDNTSVKKKKKVINALEEDQRWEYCTDAWLLKVRSRNEYSQDQINVYYLGGSFSAFTCKYAKNIIVIGSNWISATLAHEFGHSFSLEDTTYSFGTNNLMKGEGSNRDIITLGQGYRMNVDPASTLNAFSVRSGIQHSCGPGDESAVCPALDFNREVLD